MPIAIIPRVLPWAKSFWAFSPYINHLRKLRILYDLNQNFKTEHLLRLNTEILVEFGDSGTIRILQILYELTLL